MSDELIRVQIEEPEAPVAEPAPETVSADGAAARAQPLTVESALWLLLGLGAAFMRFADIGRWSLAEAEAALALEAWHFVSGMPYTMVGAGLPTVLSPLAFNLDAITFALFGAGDAAARVPQALGGIALVLAPWLLRPLVGRGTALVMSALLVLSPTVLFFSRHASGAIWSALFSLLLVAGVARWLRWRRRADAALAAVALGMGLASGPGFWSVLAAGVLFYGYLSWRGRRRGGEEEASQAEESVESEGASGAPFAGAIRELLTPGALAIALVTFVVTSTGLFLNLQGLGAALNLPIAWLRALAGVGPSLVIPFLFVLWLYESLILLAAFAGGALLAERRAGWTIFCFAWAGVTLVPATLSNSGWNEGILLIVVPLSLLAAAAIAELLRAALARGSAQVEGFFLLLGLSLFVYFWLNLTSYINSASTQKLIGTLAPLLLLLLAGVVVWQSFGARAAQRSLGLTLLLWLTIVSLASAWGLSVVRAADPREPLVVQPSDPDLRAAAERVEQLSIERYRERAAIPFGIQRTLGYAPRWYFRAFDARELEGGSGEMPEAALLDDEAAAPPGWIGSRVWVGPTWQWNLESGLALRWLVLRADRRLPLNEQAAVLYIRLPE